MEPGKIYASERAQYKTLVGNDGWLFIWDINGLSEMVVGDTQLSVNDLQLIGDTISARNQFCVERGIEYVHVVVPDKSAVYPEKLPVSISRPSRTVLHDVCDLVSRLSGEVKNLDLTRWLIDLKDHNADVFLKTDSHWTNPVAFAACDEILRQTSLGSRIPSIFTDVTWEEKSRIFELAALLPTPYPEKFQQPLVKNPQSKVIFENLARGRGRTMVHKGPGSAKILLFRDSFSSMFTNFLAEQCDRLVTINTQTFWEEIVASEQPDLVIFQTSERFLHPAVSDARKRSVEETFGFSIQQLRSTSNQ